MCSDLSTWRLQNINLVARLLKSLNISFYGLFFSVRSLILSLGSQRYLAFALLFSGLLVIGLTVFWHVKASYSTTASMSAFLCPRLALP